MTDVEPRWLVAAEVLALHEIALANHGGLAGVRDPNGLESAVFRPQQFYRYEDERDLCVLAALYAEGIMTHNHPFHDGNKRTGYQAADVFLYLNGLELQLATDAEERITFIEHVAAGSVSTDALAKFYRDHTAPLRRDSGHE